MGKVVNFTLFSTFNSSMYFFNSSDAFLTRDKILPSLIITSRSISTLATLSIPLTSVKKNQEGDRVCVGSRRLGNKRFVRWVVWVNKGSVNEARTGVS